MASSLCEKFILELDADTLEEWVMAYVTEMYDVTMPVCRIGVSGQAQKGVDVHACIRDVGHVGYQAKAYLHKTLTIAMFDKELKGAHDFIPPLQKYTIVTLNRRSAVLQEHARLATINGHARVQVLFLEDLAEITDSNQALKSRVFKLTVSADDLSEICIAFYGSAMPSPVHVLPAESDAGLPQPLRDAEGWISNGMPLKALEIINSFLGPSAPAVLAKLRARALYALGDHKGVLAEIDRELLRSNRSGAVLAIGALSASESLMDSRADDLLQAAMLASSEGERSDVVGCYVRLKAKRDGAHLGELEGFAGEQLADVSKVAVALAEAAVVLGDRSRAAYWYELARTTRPTLGLGIELNMLANALGLTLACAIPSETALLEIVKQLEQFAERARDVEAPTFRIAAWNNLGLAYAAVERYQDAADVWDRALMEDGAQESLWIRRCMLTANDGVPVPDEDVVRKHACAPLSTLVFASALTAIGRTDEALPLVNAVLDDAEASSDDIAMAHVERLRIKEVRAEELDDVIEDGLATLRALPESLPLLTWLILKYASASREQQGELKRLVGALDTTTLSDEQLLTIASLVSRRGFVEVLAHWNGRLGAIALKDGGIKDADAAGVLANLKLKTLDFEGAVHLRRLLMDSEPESSSALLSYAEALFEAGDRNQAFELLDDAVRGGTASTLLLLNWARLGFALGFKRRARKILGTIPSPSMESAEDYLRVMQVRALLGVDGQDDEVLAMLRRGFLTPENASTFFSLGLHRRLVTDRRVRFGSIAHLRIGEVLDEQCYLSEKKESPLPGIRSYDAASHGWVSELIGAGVGEIVKLSSSPFAGQDAVVISVSGAEDFVFQEALKQIGVSSPEVTGVEPISGSISDQLEEMKVKLTERHESVSTGMRVATEQKLPIAVLARGYKTSPREFLFESGTWVPSAHCGTTPVLEVEDEVLSQTTGWVFDPVTLLLLVTIGAEALPRRLSRRPVITKQAVATLLDWYMVEREGRRAAGHMRLDDRGELILTEYGIEHRVATLAFWRSLRSLIRDHFDVVDAPAVEVSSAMVQVLPMLGSETATGFNVARDRGYTLISEEEMVRAFASQVFEAKSASLHRLIAHAAVRGWIGSADATRWLSALIGLGWNWITFPTYVVEAALRLDSAERWTTLKRFLSRMPRADASHAVPLLLEHLRALDDGRYLGIDKTRLRAALVGALPLMDAKSRMYVAKRYKKQGMGAEHRASARLLRRWATKRDVGGPNAR